MIRFVLSLFVLLFFGQSVQARTITDAMARTVTIPDAVERVICSGPGCLRLLSYLQGQQLVVAVDDIEAKRNEFDARPYALANPQFKTMPVFGQFRGQDNPELILTLEPRRSRRSSSRSSAAWGMNRTNCRPRPASRSWWWMPATWTPSVRNSWPPCG